MQWAPRVANRLRAEAVVQLLDQIGVRLGPQRRGPRSLDASSTSSSLALMHLFDEILKAVLDLCPLEWRHLIPRLVGGRPAHLHGFKKNLSKLLQVGVCVFFDLVAGTLAR